MSIPALARFVGRRLRTAATEAPRRLVDAVRPGGEPRRRGDAFQAGDAGAPGAIAAPPPGALAQAGTSRVQRFDPPLTLSPGAPLRVPGLTERFPVEAVEVELVDGGTTRVRIGREAPPFAQPVMGELSLEGEGRVRSVTVHFARRERLGDSDFFSIPVHQEGLKSGEVLELRLPDFRRGQRIQNLNVSFHAPLRDWDAKKGREGKPTFCTWTADGQVLARKFVDPNADQGNAPEIDNVHGNDRKGMVPIAVAGEFLRAQAENLHIPADEDAMSIQWVRVTYEPRNPPDAVHDFRGRPLLNREWKGHWVKPGESLALPLDPGRKLRRVDVQWSDKQDGDLLHSGGLSSQGSLRLDGAPLGNPREHVGSPEWQTFDNLGGASGQTLEIFPDVAPLKVYEVHVFYEP